MYGSSAPGTRVTRPAVELICPPSLSHAWVSFDGHVRGFHFVKQLLHLLEPLVALDREMERQGFQAPRGGC